jgi:membrane-associated protease RseP (regulator of RpoE activity)
MPGLPQDSSGSPPHSATPLPEVAVRARPANPPLAWRANAGLFLATVGSAFYTYLKLEGAEPTRVAEFHALQFTAALLSILLAHEFGHFIAARVHKVDASLPYFIPLPLLSPFGTMGAVIRMRSLIPTRRALLDIGAAGPLAGLALAIPLYAWGAAHSQVVSLDSFEGGLQLGDSLLLRVLNHFFAPAIPAGSDLSLSPVAFAAWGGMFVTMINLLPVGQLDGGHVAYSLFGPRQDRIATWVHKSMLVFFFVSVFGFVVRDARGGLWLWHLGRHVQSSLFWLVWFEVLAVLGSMTRGRNPVDPSEGRLSASTRLFATVSLVVMAALFYDVASGPLWLAWFVGLGVLLAMERKWGVLRPGSSAMDHPPTGPGKLDGARMTIAIVTLAFFVLLFMPTPISL